MRIYNKLVRDKIPQIIEANGACCEVRIADKNELYMPLEAKLKEEVREF
jgi:predicted house-cleaning noncanonical NTP pyrophosphatase (MazG superfamily)